MVANFLAGGAVVNAFAAEMGAEVVVDRRRRRGHRSTRRPGCGTARCGRGTADLAEGPAMTVDEARAGGRGRHRGGDAAWRPARAAWSPATWGSATPRRRPRSSARSPAPPPRRPPAAAPASTTAPGSARSRSSPGRARGCPEPPSTPQAAIAALAEVGGLEHAALAGFLLGAAAHRTPVILDGAIAGAAALVAAALCPAALEFAVAGHVSQEAGHAIALRAPRAAPAAGAGPPARRGHRRAAGLAAGRRRGPGAAGRRHLRRRGCHRQERLTGGRPGSRPGILSPDRASPKRRPAVVPCDDEEAPWATTPSRTRTCSRS